MISLKSILEGESNTDMFTFKQKDAVGVRPSYQNTKVLKQLGIMKFAVTDLGKMDWNTAKTACDELILNGYSDWHLPKKIELDKIFHNLFIVEIGNFENNVNYWTSQQYDNFVAWAQYFYKDKRKEVTNYEDSYMYFYREPLSTEHSLRAVRSF